MRNLQTINICRHSLSPYIPKPLGGYTVYGFYVQKVKLEEVKTKILSGHIKSKSWNAKLGRQSTIRVQKKKTDSISSENVSQKRRQPSKALESGDNDSSGKWNGSVCGLMEGHEGKAWGTLEAWLNEELSVGLKEQREEEI